MSSANPSRLSAARIAVGYAVVSASWIVFSDVFLSQLGASRLLLTFKGIGFVVVTACLLYLTIKRLISKVESASLERDRTEKLYRTVVDSSEEGICLLDESGKIVFLNNRLASLLCGSEGSLTGRYIQDFVVEPRFVLPNGHAIAVTQPQEYRLRTKHDSSRWVLVSATSLSDDKGEFSGSLALFLDITERKRLESELRQSQKLEALGTFAGGITHDFNNLLSIMTGYGTLLENATPPGSVERRAAREILSACHRGSLLIRQLLAFSRKQAIVPEIVRLCDVVGSFGEVLPRIVGEHIEVTVRCEDSGACVRIGAGQIEQILMNLASNARDAMPDGGSLLVSTSAIQVADSEARAHGVQTGMFAVITVRDTGLGITPEIKSHIFEPFFTTKPHGAGTGLGLSTVYGIVAQHGGYIEFDSVLGEGTTFKVHLPVTEVRSNVVEFRSAAPTSVVGTETILLVEDEGALRALTKHILSTHGYTVFDAANGADAIQIVSGIHKKLDLLLTDVVMPGMSGVDLAKEVARLSPSTRIAFMSGYSDFPIHVSGVVEIIQKPIAPDALLVKVRAILDR